MRQMAAATTMKDSSRVPVDSALSLQVRAGRANATLPKRPRAQVALKLQHTEVMCLTFSADMARQRPVSQDAALPSASLQRRGYRGTY